MKKLFGFAAGGLFALAVIIVFLSCPDKDADGEGEGEGEGYAITFNANGGIFSNGSTTYTLTSTTQRTIGGDFPNPNPTRPGYIFDDYRTDDVGGIRVTPNTKFKFTTAEYTVYASWIDENDKIGVYYVKVKTDLGDLNNVTTDLTLPAGENGVTVAWTSDNTTYLTNAGKVTRPASNPVVVNLTGKFTQDGVSKSYVFIVTILANYGPDVDAAIAAVTIQLGSLNQVTANLNLPAAHADTGVSISWSSSNTSVLGNDGTVNRPPSTSADATVTLTGTFTKGTNDADRVTKTKVFTVTILHLPNQNDVDIDAAIAAITAQLGSLNQVTANLTLPAAHDATGVSINWSSSNTAVLSDTGTVTRPSALTGNVVVTLTGTFTKGGVTRTKDFTVTVLAVTTASADEELVLKAIKKAEIALGDLSTKDANFTLPASDSSVTVNWSYSGAGVSISGSTATVSRGSDAQEGTLTGTFTLISDPTVTTARTWNVRVMRSEATWDEYLNVHYKAVSASEFKNNAYSGGFYSPALMGSTAQIKKQTGVGGANAGQEYFYVDLGNGGYIDLGPKVGALLRKPEWTVELWIWLPSDANTMMSFANDAAINTTSQSPWRGTVMFHNTGLWFSLFNNGVYNLSSIETGNGAVVTAGAAAGNSGGVGGRINQWLHLAIVKRNQTSDTIRIMRNWTKAMNGDTNNLSRISTDAAFGSGSTEEWDLRYGYLGRSVLSGVSSLNANLRNTTIDGGRIYEFKVYTKAVPLSGNDYPSRSDLLTQKKNFNDAFGAGNND